jgi:hypothetical protein
MPIRNVLFCMGVVFGILGLAIERIWSKFDLSYAWGLPLFFASMGLFFGLVVSAGTLELAVRIPTWRKQWRQKRMLQEIEARELSIE